MKRNYGSNIFYTIFGSKLQKSFNPMRVIGSNFSQRQKNAEPACPMMGIHILIEPKRIGHSASIASRSFFTTTKSSPLQFQPQRISNPNPNASFYDRFQPHEMTKTPSFTSPSTPQSLETPEGKKVNPHPLIMAMGLAQRKKEGLPLTQRTQPSPPPHPNFTTCALCAHVSCLLLQSCPKGDSKPKSTTLTQTQIPFLFSIELNNKPEQMGIQTKREPCIN